MLRSVMDELNVLAMGWLASDFRGRLMVDAEFRVSWINAAASRLVSASEILILHQEQLSFFNKSDETRFGTFLSTLRTKAGHEVLALEDGEGQLVFCGWHDADTGISCLEVNLAHAEERPLFADFRSAFGLTDSETQTALALFNGKTVTEVADARKVSVETVRTQVRKVYVKMGAQSREKFYKKLMPFRIT